MSSTTPRLTYNITSRNNDIDKNNSYYTYNNINQNYENINKDILFQPQYLYDNQNTSLLNQTTPLPYNPVYQNEISYINNSNINNISYNDNRFSRIHSRLDEINDKINKEKEKEKEQSRISYSSNSSGLKIYQTNFIQCIRFKDFPNLIDTESNNNNSLKQNLNKK